MRNDTKSHFKENLDLYAKEYLEPDTARNTDQKILGMVVRRVISRLEGPDVLEMGYGDGAWSAAVMQRFGRTHLVDAFPELAATARMLHADKITVYTSYFEEFEAPKQFDSIICTCVLEHVVDPVAVLRRAREWTKPKGLVFVAVPNATSIHRRLGVAMKIQKDIYELGDADISVGHRRVYDAETLEHHLRQAGLVIEMRLPMFFKPLPNSLLAYLNDAQLEGLMEVGDEMPEDQRGILAYFCRAT
jgi:2-polyprenyl-3-methyl-5-hydroxy-6-metoxy-1,4-benzoquinol methylase